MRYISVAIAFMLFSLTTVTFTGCGEDSNTTTTGGSCGENSADMLSGENPTITLCGDTTIEITLGTNEVLADDSFSAYDPQDGDLTAEVVRTNNIDFSHAGTYTVTYTVEDSDGNRDVKYRTVKIVGSDSYNVYSGENAGVGSQPTIFFTDGNGGDTLFLNLNQFYDRTAYYATDTEDGDLTASVVVSGNVDTSVAGVYDVTYTVTDSDGNTATKTRTVYVGQSDLGTPVGSDNMTTFKRWYSNTCGQTFNTSLYNAQTGAYNGKIDCSNQGLTSIDLSPLSVFVSIKSLDLSHNSLSSIDFNQLDLSVNNVKVLEDLDLSYNNFSYIDFQPLHNLKNINRLWIQGNNLDYSTKAKRDALYSIFNNRSLTIYFDKY